MNRLEPFPEKLTFREKYGPAMDITDQAEADAWFERCVEHTMRYATKQEDRTREGAEACERSNLGYFAGYCDAETFDRVMRLFRCVHPIFGTVYPTMTQAFEAGRTAGTAHLKEDKA